METNPSKIAKERNALMAKADRDLAKLEAAQAAAGDRPDLAIGRTAAEVREAKRSIEATKRAFETKVVER